MKKVRKVENGEVYPSIVNRKNKKYTLFDFFKVDDNKKKINIFY